MSLTFIDCNGLAGFLSLGFVNSGIEMSLRTGTLNFGAPVAEANRRHLGHNWSSYFSDSEDEWPTQKADVVVGCPPCSGWSVWSGPNNRGEDAAAHEHTRAFMRYAAKVKPTVVVFECVQQAYSQGRAVMLKYRELLESVSNKKYDLHHVKMNNLQVGGFSYRPRYFWVAVQSGLAFGAGATMPDTLPTVNDVIGDLMPLEVKWDAQAYTATPTPYVQSLISKSGTVTGHMNKNNANSKRVSEIFDILGNSGWPARFDEGQALKMAVAQNNDTFPQSWARQEEKLRSKDFYVGFSNASRWPGDSYCNVLTGGCMDHVVHPTLPRLITHREAARIQGLPDDWEIVAVKDYSFLGATWGKAVALQAANWIADAVLAALNGEPNGPTGELIGDREYLVETDKGFSRNFVKKKWYS